MEAQRVRIEDRKADLMIKAMELTVAALGLSDRVGEVRPLVGRQLRILEGKPQPAHGKGFKPADRWDSE